MNCHDVTPLLSAERDGPLDAGVREALERHVAACPACRRARADLAAAAEAWRDATARATTPDPAGEWRTLRARLRAAEAGAGVGAGATAAGGAPSREPASRRISAWLLAAGAFPAAAAAVWLAVLVLKPVLSGSRNEPAPVVAFATPQADTVLPARVDYVEASADASPVVYLDQESGWLIVWAEAPEAPGSG